MRVPGGAPAAWVWGVGGRALSHPRLPALWAGCRGPLPTGCGCGGVRAWGPVTNPTARALSSWLCALWGRHEGARLGEILYHTKPAWRYTIGSTPEFWLISSSQNDPLLGPQFDPPPCGQLAAPYLSAHGELGPNFKLYTQI